MIVGSSPSPVPVPVKGFEQATIVIQGHTRLTNVFPIFRYDWDNGFPPIARTLLQSGEYGGDGWPFPGFLSVLLNPGRH